MSVGNAVTHNKELKQLLQPSKHSGDGGMSADGLHDKAKKVTIRGELDQISLTDIFQTLAMSKMTGILRVYRPSENRLVQFSEAGVRLLASHRKENQRFGQRLVHSGRLRTTTLQKALTHQKQTKAPLGDSLVNQGVITPVELEKALLTQLEEDLYSLFDWTSGSFEFYKDHDPSSEQTPQSEGSLTFVIHGLLLEAARRSDEWCETLRTLGSVQEVPCFLNRQQLPTMTGAARRVCKSIDASSSIQELSEATMVGLLDCAKTICQLMEQGLVALSPAPRLLKLAQTAADSGDYSRTLQRIQTIQDHRHELDAELVRALVEILRTCRQPKVGATILVDCAKSLNNSSEQLEIAKAAFEMDQHSVGVLQFLHRQLQDGEQNDGPLFELVTDKLCTALTKQGDHVVALQYHQALAVLQPDSHRILVRQGSLLHACGRTEEALHSLSLARGYAEHKGDKPQIIEVYQQILKVDEHAKDISRALSDLRQGTVRQQKQRFGVLVAGAIALGLGWLSWSWYSQHQQFSSAVAEIQTRLSKHDTKGAWQYLVQAQSSLGDGAIWDPIQNEIEATSKAIEAERRTIEITAVDRRLGQADALLAQGNVKQALRSYQTEYNQHTKHKAIRQRIKHSANKQWLLTLKTLQDYSTGLQAKLPVPVSKLTQLEVLQQGAALLRSDPDDPSDLANSILTHADDESFTQWVSPALAQTILKAARELIATSHLATERRDDYLQRIDVLAKNKRLNPVFEAARQAEQTFDFARAEKLYRELYREYQSNSEHAPNFQKLVSTYAIINETLRALTKCTQAGDFPGARSYYQSLQSQFSGAPWGTLIQLPVRITTTPAGATLSQQGKVLGTSPLTLAFSPATPTRIEIRHPNFVATHTTLDRDSNGVAHCTLTLAPKWSTTTKGIIEQSPQSDGERTYMVDRSGSITAWSMQKQQQLWAYDTGDLSGMLTRPILHQQQILVGSIDGELRALDPATGKPLWTLPNLPTESALLCLGSDLVIATTDKRLVVIDLTKHSIRRTIQLQAKPVCDLGLIQQCALVVLNNGTMQAIPIAQDQEPWSPITLDPGLPTQPLIYKHTIVTCSDEGYVSAYHVDSGKRLWHHSKLGEFHWQASTNGSEIFVATNATSQSSACILTLDILTGQPGSAFRSAVKTVWSGSPHIYRDSIIIGTTKGPALVLSQSTLQVRFKIHGNGAMCAKPAFLPSGEAICCFNDKGLSIFPPLPTTASIQRRTSNSR
jgi:tetratricopeptide (TPR) repeat protein/outer membrane protein assembly factor BamB